ncbi:MAG: hypothetical protein AB1637_07905 [Elusimicrobiota bacterium]
MKDGKKSLCELAKEKNKEELKSLALKAEYICPCCFRVSNDQQRICCEAEKIENKGFFKKIIAKIDGKLSEESKKDCCKGKGCC